MRKGQRRSPDTEWGEYTQQEAANYHTKLSLKCCDAKTYQRWFTLAERGNFPCRTLKSFCKDCLPSYQQEMQAEGKCVASEKGLVHILPRPSE